MLTEFLEGGWAFEIFLIGVFDIGKRRMPSTMMTIGVNDGHDAVKSSSVVGMRGGGRTTVLSFWRVGLHRFYLALSPLFSSGDDDGGEEEEKGGGDDGGSP